MIATISSNGKLTMNKRIDLTPFIGSGFDMEFFDRSSLDGWCHALKIGQLDEISEVPGNKTYWFPVDRSGFRFWRDYCRPRLNKPQVLDDYSKVLCEGLMWEVGYSWVEKRRIEHDSLCLSSSEASYFMTVQAYRIEYLTCIGLEEGYEEQAAEWDYPVIRSES